MSSEKKKPVLSLNHRSFLALRKTECYSSMFSTKVTKMNFWAVGSETAHDFCA